ncbi:MAG: sigma 54-interacting transcriptional regulator [Planctomycetota bacterium]|jgi:transcriptional regulator with PAS, ATPase and Fis domain|nr:sigma 54-interacting transcriptional regulator [Planctomycetota bacterium]
MTQIINRPTQIDPAITLAAIQPYLTRFAKVLSSVLGIDAEIMDVNFIRLAGTGIYEAGIGSSIDEANFIYKHAIKMKSFVRIDNPRESEVCDECANKATCRETLSLCTTLQVGGQVLGVLGLVCFNARDRARILRKVDFYVEFVKQIAEVIEQKALEQKKAADAGDLLDALLEIMDIDDRGVLIFDWRRNITFMNKVARAEFSRASNSVPGNELRLRKTRNSFGGLQEFEILFNDRKTKVVGSLSEIRAGPPHFSSALVFEALPKMTRKALDFSASNPDTKLAAIVGASPQTLQLKSDIMRLAHSPSTVLITGESGTGKELVAQAIHNVSDRRQAPFVAINCGGIPNTLLESELFGYDRGAFTGGLKSGKIGKFEMANGGTVFLDEIGSMPIYMQVKLLRVLQERQISRLGSNDVIDVDVRIIAATNENLAERISQNMFRGDLFYRLNVIPLEIAPLRERKEDIKALSQRFVDFYCKRLNKSAGRIPHYIMNVLYNYAWPGNVRELQNCVEYMVNAIQAGQPWRAEHLPPKLRGPAAGRLAAGAAAPSPRSLREVEREHIMEALRAFPGNNKGKKEAARALGIGIATLYRKIGEYGIAADAPERTAMSTASISIADS